MNQLSNLGQIPTFPLSLLDFFYISQLPLPLSHCNHHTFKIASAKLCLPFINNQRNWYLPHGTNCIWSCIVLFLKNNSCTYVPPKYSALCFICSRALVYVGGGKEAWRCCYSVLCLLILSGSFPKLWVAQFVCHSPKEPFGNDSQFCWIFTIPTIRQAQSSPALKEDNSIWNSLS